MDHLNIDLSNNNLERILSELIVSMRIFSAVSCREKDQIRNYKAGKILPHYYILRTWEKFFGCPIEYIYPEVTKIDKWVERFKALHFEGKEIIIPSQHQIKSDLSENQDN